VVLVEGLENAIVHGFNCTCDKQATGIAQNRQQISMLEQMLDLDCDVVSHARKFMVKRLDDGNRMGWSVEEIRVAKSDMLCAGRDLLSNIGKHNIPLNHAKLTAIDRDNRAMTAKVLATAARLSIARDARGLTIPFQPRVFGKFGQTGTVGGKKLLTIERDDWFGLHSRGYLGVGEPFIERNKRLFEFAA
jgi:hypothetical protein